MIPSGITVQPISSSSEPSICVASRPWRRRYFVAKNATAAKIRVVIARETTTRKMYKASSQNACDDAIGGQSGKLSNILMRAALPPGAVFRIRASSKKYQQHSAETKNRHAA